MELKIKWLLSILLTWIGKLYNIRGGEAAHVPCSLDAIPQFFVIKKKNLIISGHMLLDWHKLLRNVFNRNQNYNFVSHFSVKLVSSS